MDEILGLHHEKKIYVSLKKYGADCYSFFPCGTQNICIHLPKKITLRKKEGKKKKRDLHL